MKAARGMRQLIFLVLFFDLAFGPSNCFGLWIGRKRFVRIVNQLDNEQLHYHCWSNDDDLGDRSLAPNGDYWEFKFHLDFDTKFTCDMNYSNYRVHFDIFYADDELIEKCGGVHCIWKAEETGIYLFHIKTGDWEKVYDWGTN